MIVSIHQPNFMPWLGFFDKVNKSDAFIFLTASVRSKGDKYLTRARILNHSKEQFLTIPLGAKEIAINQLKMPDENSWKVKMLNKIHGAYQGSIFFDEIYGDIELLIMSDAEYYSSFSIDFIKFMLKKLAIDTVLHIDSDFKNNFGASNARNISLCKVVGGHSYLSGSGAHAYIDERLFKANKVELIFQDFQHPKYEQGVNDFVAGLSIIDVLFNCGYDRTRNFLR